MCIYVHIHKHTYVHACVCTCLGIPAITWDQCGLGIKWTSSHTQITAQEFCGVNIYIYIYAAMPQSCVQHVYRWLHISPQIRKLWLLPHVPHYSTWPKCMAGSWLRLRILMTRICGFEIVININWFECSFFGKE